MFQKNDSIKLVLNEGAKSQITTSVAKNEDIQMSITVNNDMVIYMRLGKEEASPARYDAIVYLKKVSCCIDQST